VWADVNQVVEIGINSKIETPLAVDASLCAGGLAQEIDFVLEKLFEHLEDLLQVFFQKYQMELPSSQVLDFLSRASLNFIRSLKNFSNSRAVKGPYQGPCFDFS